MACLDTNVLIDLTGRGGRARHEAASALVRELRAEGRTLATTRLNVAELYVGVERSTDRDSEERRVETVLGGLIVPEFDDTAARQFAMIDAYLSERGRPVGDMDALIAAVTIVHGRALVTLNVRHFEPIPGLRIQSY